ncbi:MAG: 1-deoxy-D-xylulose-5-phosphate reductoisomerase [Eubacteriales bacterium]|jgi:1-deoxy-D-xylulose-5-phosphate reductoisomerase|nr:1-deoxy-D-xylulose-5-phosphate reductoisomerase [Lachnospiraceae bacterium]MDD5860643.1 1-deoxy-D-xylulose-5-phosphate reductoisomerase [Eubacteriales bacterium]MCH4064445.1 1-deoxy-D-xylulose-5-phosphate reductoisomerase [Lachnospiraceae bacterium]MCH4102830.1 1-deoxy-D-xylulose-5-phosphate reductoisomerase [Lachnospiraceae bacterium]MCI1308681.1 1-deoxy-D-xylulose-5-phosphate reductoisomerase [Lachnospiraceae bacterium]
MKHIAVLGSTGSIGTQTLDVVRMHGDQMKITGLACGRSVGLMEKQAREFRPEICAVYDEAAAEELKVRLADTEIRVVSGMDGLIEMCSMPSADIVVTGIVGMIGIRPTIAAIEAGKDIALANKETCVCAGHIIMPLAKRRGVRILPVDSEHSAIFQSLQGRAGSKIRKILLTASGGPFRGMTREELAHVTVKEALAHPTWSMGPKVTIDSASMVNKGLEVIEARWLFDVDPDQIQVVIQPQSIIHSAVQYEDNSVIAQLAVSDMRIPIQYALTWPMHLPSPAAELDFAQMTGIEIGVPDDEVFRGLPLARQAIRTGGSMPCVFNAANEWANAWFRKGKISFLQIYDIIEETMAAHHVIADPSVEDILAIEAEVDARCEEVYGK